MRPKNNETPEDARSDDDDIAARFPNIDTDDRLKTSREPLPDAPEVPVKQPTLPEVKIAGLDGNRAEGRDAPSARDVRGMGIALSISATLFGSIVAGVLLGWAVDKYIFHDPATPWGMIVGFFLGTISAFSSVMRLVKQLEQEQK